MKISSLFIVLFASILITNCSNPQKDVTNEIVEANKVWSNFFNANDGASIGKLYTDNARLLPANSPVIEGQEAIGEFWNAVLGMGIEDVALSTVHVESFENTAIEEGTYKLFDANNNQLDEGKYIVIWKNIDGQWKLDRDMFSSNVPLPVQDPAEEKPTGENTEN